jgi:glycerol-3-phosphate dehydrogenase
LAFILPHAKHLRPAWMIRIGLFLYDHLAQRKKLPGSKQIKLSELSGGNPLKEDFKIGFRYFDGWIDDARLVVTNALAAQEQGAEILVRTECKKARYINKLWTVELFDQRTQQTRVVQAKTIVNAAGPWVNLVLETAFGMRPKKSLQWIKGSHIVVPKIYDGDEAFILQGDKDLQGKKDPRIIFVIPYEKNYSVIGTTDVAHHDAAHLDHLAITDDEIDYLCHAVNFYFTKSIAKKDICWSYAGVRALASEPGEDPSKMTRDYALELEDHLLNIYGGKITTYRVLAETVMKKLKPLLPHMSSASTHDKILPGGDIDASFETQLTGTYPWLPQELAHRYTHHYGSRSQKILKNCESLQDLGPHFGHGLYEKEVRYLIDEEWACSAEDILWRRSKLGLCFTADEIAALDKYCRTH